MKNLDALEWAAVVYSMGAATDGPLNLLREALKQARSAADSALHAEGPRKTCINRINRAIELLDELPDAMVAEMRYRCGG